MAGRWHYGQAGGIVAYYLCAYSTYCFCFLFCFISISIPVSIYVHRCVMCGMWRLWCGAQEGRGLLIGPRVPSPIIDLNPPAQNAHM